QWFNSSSFDRLKTEFLRHHQHRRPRADRPFGAVRRVPRLYPHVANIVLKAFTLGVRAILGWSKQSVFVNLANKLNIIIIITSDVFLNIPLDWSNPPQLDVILRASNAVVSVYIANRLELFHHFPGLNAAGTGKPLFWRQANVINRRIHLENCVSLDTA